MKNEKKLRKMFCPKIEVCKKMKTYTFFRLTCMGDYEDCYMFDGCIETGRENRVPREWMNPPQKWWLISNDDIQTLRNELTGSSLHTLESGLHLTDCVPDDFRQTSKKIENAESLKEIIADLIYTADWEITPRPVNGFDSVYMINEDDVVQEIIDAVLEAQREILRSRG